MNKLGGQNGIDFQPYPQPQSCCAGAAAVGLARAGFEYARDYAKERVQFGEPIAHRQSIAFMLADMATEVDRSPTIGLGNGLEAGSGDKTRRRKPRS